MTRVTADGVSLAVHEWPGTGPAIVCIHGLTANHVCWLSMADSLAPRHRLIGYDLRGRGDSDKPPTGYSYTVLLGKNARVKSALQTFLTRK